MGLVTTKDGAEIFTRIGGAPGNAAVAEIEGALSFEPLLGKPMFGLSHSSLGAVPRRANYQSAEQMT